MMAPTLTRDDFAVNVIAPNQADPCQWFVPPGAIWPIVNCVCGNPARHEQTPAVNLNVAASETVRPGEIHFMQYGRTVGKIVNVAP